MGLDRTFKDSHNRHMSKADSTEARVFTGIMLRPDIRELLKERAVAEGRSLSNMAERLLEEALSPQDEAA